ncbi:MAG TPA: 2-oxoisovalerate dehydrogenase [Syntrophomonadaceae bacterium]|nr:2-oxoisovalerate dehydrogenase [Syntrophomonadaceae bacterium]
MDKEIIFLVEEAPEGGYVAKALGHSIFTEGDSMDEIKTEIKDAIRCHFSEDELPQILRLHFVKEEVIAI